MQNEQLILKYRPKTFDEFMGNESLIESLRHIFEREEGIPHCFLLQGPSGCGKTTLARIIGTKLKCSQHDFIEMDIAQTRGIDTARQIKADIKLMPFDGPVKVYVLDESHMATKEFFNAMLKEFEEPPKHVYFVLCTTEPEKILPTIRGQRAMVCQLRSLRKQEIKKLLLDVCEKEDVEFPDTHIDKIVSVCQGSPRAALMILDQIIDIDDDEEAFEAISVATVSTQEVKDIIGYLMKPGKKTWLHLSKILRKIDMTQEKPEQIRYALKGYFGTVFLNRPGDLRAYQIMCLFLQPFYNSGREGLIDALYLASQIK